MGGTLQISTLLAASSISSLSASALAPVGCMLLDKPEDLEVCCHLMENRRKMISVSQTESWGHHGNTTKIVTKITYGIAHPQRKWKVPNTINLEKKIKSFYVFIVNRWWGYIALQTEQMFLSLIATVLTIMISTLLLYSSQCHSCLPCKKFSLEICI